MNCVLLPVMALQGSNAVWHHREEWLPLGPEVGSLLLSALFLVAAGMSLPSIRLMKRYGYGPLIVANYMTVLLFLLSHINRIWELISLFSWTLNYHVAMCAQKGCPVVIGVS